MSKRVVIAGGGITGLSAAFYLGQWCRENRVSATITLIEKEGRPGGKIATVRQDGFVIETGPDSFLARKQPIIDLTYELGLEAELVPTRPAASKTYVYRAGKLHRLPPGLVMGIPTRIAPFLGTRLISWPGKLRAGLDVAIPRRRAQGDESIGAFLRRRLGNEVVDYMAEPLLAGIYSSQADLLSIQATFPHFHALEQKKRSLILGMISGLNRAAVPPSRLPDHLGRSVFLSYRNGLASLVEALQDRLREAKWITGESLTAIGRLPEGGYQLLTDAGRTLVADAVVAALPAYAIGALFPRLPAVQKFAQMPYASVANVVLGYARDEIRHELDGSGFVVPRKEGRFITACTWSSSKWEHTAPANCVLIRCYVGRHGEEEWMNLDDDAILAGVRRELRDICGIAAEPVFSRVTRHVRAMPQYEVGHLERMATARAELARHYPGVFLAGAAFSGVGLPDCVRQGKEAAQQVLRYLAGKN